MSAKVGLIVAFPRLVAEAKRVRAATGKRITPAQVDALDPVLFNPLNSENEPWTDANNKPISRSKMVFQSVLNQLEEGKKSAKGVTPEAVANLRAFAQAVYGIGGASKASEADLAAVEAVVIDDTI